MDIVDTLDAMQDIVDKRKLYDRACRKAFDAREKALELNEKAARLWVELIAATDALVPLS